MFSWGHGGIVTQVANSAQAHFQVSFLLQLGVTAQPLNGAVYLRRFYVWRIFNHVGTAIGHRIGSLQAPSNSSTCMCPQVDIDLVLTWN